MINVHAIHNFIGKISGYTHCDSSILDTLDLPADEFLILNSGIIDGGLFYYDLVDQILPRPENPTTISGYILTNLPIPSTIRIGSEEFLVEDGELEMAFDLPGTYTINVDSFPFQDATFEVTV
jgi:hypothetical protein